MAEATKRTIAVSGWFRGDESGAVLVIVSVSFLALLGLAAIVVDGGLLFNEKRSAQNAADHAALAAAWADCNGGNPQVAANASVAKNGYTAANLTLTTSPPSYTVRVDSTIDMAFAGIIGYANAGVSAEAVAECVGGGSGSGGGGDIPVDAAIWTYGWFFNKGSDNNFESVFANGDGCNDGASCDSNRYGSIPDGNIGPGNHFVNGNENTYGSVSCTLSGCISGSGDFKNSPATNESAPVVTEFPYPDDFNEFVNAYTGGYTIKYSWDGQCDGVYVLSSDVTVTSCPGSRSTNHTFSVITSGTFEIKVDELHMQPEIPGVLIASFADESMWDSGAGEDSGWAIKFDANETGSHLGGLLYAPNGSIVIASDEALYEGAIVAESFYLKDNANDFQYNDALLPSAPSPASVGEPILME